MAPVEILKAILIGIVEGITEWLPVSSTGHMILLNEWVKLQVSESFWEFFLVAIQLGAILAVVVLFWQKIFPFRLGRKDRQEGGQEGESESGFIKKDIVGLWVRIAIAAAPAAVAGLLLDDWLDEHLYGPTTVAVALIAYGIWFLFLERKQDRVFSIEKAADIPWKTALVIGLFQVLALIPGTSRSGATIIGGMLAGASRPAAAEFTFYLAIPVMAGASLLKLLKVGFAFSGQELAILAAGSVTAFIVSMGSIGFLMRYVRNHDFKAFGVYRIALGLCVLAYFYFA
mgnify:CR=1 FL=1